MTGHEAARSVQLAIATDLADTARLTGHDGLAFSIHRYALPALDEDPIRFRRLADAIVRAATTTSPATAITTYRPP